MAEFARRMSVSRASVQRWRDQGRLVMDGKKVVVEPSIEMLESTKGHRSDVAQRHQLGREQRQILADTPQEAIPDAILDQDSLRHDLRAAALQKALSEARIKKAEADLREMERDRQQGNLVLREDVDYVLNDLGALLRSMTDGRAERLGAELGLTPAQILQISESDEQLLTELAERLKARGK